MITINIIEIDHDGEILGSQHYTLKHLPRIEEKIILAAANGNPRVYKVMDVHHNPDDLTNVYVLSDYRSIKSLIQSTARNMN